MLVQHHREKLINAIIFFSRRTQHCYKTKLIKLLYFLDFEHYKEVGRSVTGLKYYAWKMGPVPTELFEELDDPAEDMRSNLKVTQETYRHSSGEERCQVSIKPISEFDQSLFSKREMRLMERLVERYHSQLSDDMITATHELGLPWHRVYNEQKRRQEEIPYSYILSEEDRELVEGLATERREVIENYA